VCSFNTPYCIVRGVRVAQLLKAWIRNLCGADWSPTARKVSSWLGALASLLIKIASVASERHGKTNGGPDQWIIVDHFMVVKDLPLHSHQEYLNFRQVLPTLSSIHFSSRKRVTPGTTLSVVCCLVGCSICPHRGCLLPRPGSCHPEMLLIIVTVKYQRWVTDLWPKHKEWVREW